MLGTAGPWIEKLRAKTQRIEAQPYRGNPNVQRVTQVRDLEAAHGPVRWIVLPSKAVEHKVLAGRGH